MPCTILGPEEPITEKSSHGTYDIVGAAFIYLTNLCKSWCLVTVLVTGPIK